jgi:glutaredoxin
MKVTLFTKPDCGLCHEAEAMLRRMSGKIRFELELVDIDADSSAYTSYRDRIPVIAVNGEEVAAAPLDEKRLASLLKSRGAKNPL